MAKVEMQLMNVNTREELAKLLYGLVENSRRSRTT